MLFVEISADFCFCLFIYSINKVERLNKQKSSKTPACSLSHSSVTA